MYGFGMATTDAKLFAIMITIGSISMGIVLTLQLEIEKMLVLQYAMKSEREQLMGYIRMAQGIGAAVVPFLVSGSVLFAGYWLMYLVTGALFALLTPCVH